jgi:hypothetical protein
MLKRARKGLSKTYLRVILSDSRSLASRVQSGDFCASPAILSA